MAFAGRSISSGVAVAFALPRHGRRRAAAMHRLIASFTLNGVDPRARHAAALARDRRSPGFPSRGG
jgi:hypothetical protein